MTTPPPGYHTTYTPAGTGPRFLTRHTHTTHKETDMPERHEITADTVQDLNPTDIAAFLTDARDKLRGNDTPDTVTELRRRIEDLTAELDQADTHTTQHNHSK